MQVETIARRLRARVDAKAQGVGGGRKGETKGRTRRVREGCEGDGVVCLVVVERAN